MTQVGGTWNQVSRWVRELDVLRNGPRGADEPPLFEPGRVEDK